MKLEGVVKKIELAGAHIDIGEGRRAFLHISEIKADQLVTRVADVLKEGESITVWVKEVKEQPHVVLLTMNEPPPLDWGDIKRQMQLSGKVVSIEEFGAFVDIGAPKDGMVPVSQMSTERIEKPSDVVKVGDEVTVWVTSVSRKDNRIGLSMIEPPAVSWNDIKVGQTIRGKVTRLEKFGAFIDFGAEREGMIHVSEMDHEYVRDPSEVLKIGDEIEAKVIDVNRRKKQIRLSMKALIVEPEVEEEVEEPLLTPMELAFRQAQAQAKTAARNPATRASSERADAVRAEQEAIFQRTIEQHTPKP
jgi:ribosomal protein S1